MKKCLWLSMMIVLPISVSFGQINAKTKYRSKGVSVKKKASTFTRDKFDPKRSPELDLVAAIKTASRSRKRIILDVGGEWCPWCVYMDKFFFENKQLAKLRDDNFIWVKVNFSDENENSKFLSAFPEFPAFPHLFVLDESGELLHSQDTSPLESAKGYDLERFTQFLTAWAPKNN